MKKINQTDINLNIVDNQDIKINESIVNRNVSVLWQFINMNEYIFGIVKLLINVYSGDHKKVPLYIDIIADEGSLLQKKLEFSLDGNCEVSCALHSHVLSNGQHFINIIISNKKKEIILKERIIFSVKNTGEIAKKVSESLLKKNVCLFLEGACDSSYYDYNDINLLPWFDRPDALEIINTWLGDGIITEDEFFHFRQFVIDGYMIYEGLIDKELIDDINKEIDAAIASGYQGFQDGSSQRLTHLHNIHPNIRKLFLDRRYLDIIDKIFQTSSSPCQSLTYINGSQQDAHQDTIHLTSFPAGYMCGVWIALEDIQPDSGELEVYPKSHRLPRIYMDTVKCNKVIDDWSEFATKIVLPWRDGINSGCFNKITYRPTKGTVLIWHENLMHAGSVRRNIDLTRRSIVFHCFADGVIVYYDSTGEVGYVVPKK